MKRIAVLALGVAFLSGASVQAQMRAVGNVPGCVQGKPVDPRPYLDPFAARTLRVIVNGPTRGVLPCVRTAYREGYRIYFIVHYPGGLGRHAVHEFFKQVLPPYRHYIWAVGIGSEQEVAYIWQTHNGAHDTGHDYAVQWQATEPYVRKLLPHAILVAGGITPWGLGFLKEALHYGLPGAQVISAHPYIMRKGFQPGQFFAVARKNHKRAWIDEAWNGNDITVNGHTHWWYGPPSDEIRRAQLAGVWLN